MTTVTAGYEELLMYVVRWYASKRPPNLARFSLRLTRHLTELEMTQMDAAVKVLLLTDSGRAALVLFEPHDGSKPMMLYVPEPTDGKPLH